MIDLQQFCSTDIKRAALERPFLDGEFTYATDGRIIIRLLASEFPSETNSAAPKNVATFQKWDHEGFTIWQDLPSNIPAEDTWLPCRVCDGYGEHYCTDCETHHECGKCDGAGRKYRATPIEVGVSKIDAKYLRKIAALPEAQIQSPYLPNVAVAFKFKGGVGYVMPIKTE